MTRKQAIKEFKREGMIIPESAVKLAISDMEKIEKIEKIITKYQDALDNFYGGKPRDLLESDVLRDIKEVLEKE